MAQFKWTKAMSVGIPLIDKQHHRFFDILNKLEDSIAEGSAPSEIEEILRSLVEYMHFHFQTEEDYMKENFFHEFSSHREQHEIFSSHVRDLMRQFRAGERNLAEPTRHFLVDWLTKHIMDCDQKYAKSIKAEIKKSGGNKPVLKLKKK